MKYLCVDFETNGFSVPKKGVWVPLEDWTLPFSSYPIQVSADLVDDGVVEHAYDAVVSGATSLSPWTKQNVSLTLSEIAAGKPFAEVLSDLAVLVDENTTIVAHNASFDLNIALRRTAVKLGLGNSPSLKKIMELPAKQRFCTMRCAYSKAVFGSKQPKLADLCEHFGVELRDAHDARADSLALAQCVAEALRRGVMLE